jgi:DNA replication and repair protein RecF
MKLSKIKISNLRNHSYTNLELAEHLNVFYGLNGAGKTTILEAVSICSFTKTFQTVPENSLIKENETFYQARVDGISEVGVSYFTNVNFELNSKKKISSSEGDNLSAKDIVGRIPLIILSPDMKAITSGAPADRRSFIDRTLSQISPLYMQDLVRLKRCLKQRNSLLTAAKKERRLDNEQFNILTGIFIDLSVNIVYKRYNFIKEFQPYFSSFYANIGSSDESVAISYLPDTAQSVLSSGDKSQIRSAFMDRAKDLRNYEIMRGTTLFGPQKDDLFISINNSPAKERASQGQHKSLLISLKFAEFLYLKDILEETPIILLDDIFSELDIERSRKVIELINQNGAQSLITITNPARLQSFEPIGSNRYFKINAGIVEQIQDKYEP